MNRKGARLSSQEIPPMEPRCTETPEYSPALKQLVLPPKIRTRNMLWLLCSVRQWVFSGKQVDWVRKVLHNPSRHQNPGV